MIPVMVTALKKTVTVQPGGLIEIRSPELTPGSNAEVIVLVEQPHAGSSTLSSFIGAAKGTFNSIEEADAFLSNEREQWDR
jgi:hypothetical protein